MSRRRDPARVNPRRPFAVNALTICLANSCAPTISNAAKTAEDEAVFHSESALS